MPWSTPTLATVRQNNRDYVTARLRQPLIPNDYPRFLADANAGNAHLNLQYLDWQATQLLPDTAERQFLDKWANIFLTNADGSRGRKVATFSAGTISIAASVAGNVLPAGAFLTALSGTGSLTFQTTAATTIATTATPVPIRALDAGAASNLEAGTALSLSVSVPGIKTSASVVALSGGTDEESDDELRARVLFRIRKPPMGGDADDYVFWALQVPGVTRAWCSPMEMGPGTVTLRFMMDDLRATADPMTSGFPLAVDVAAVQAHLETQRPVTADVFAIAPLPEPIPFAISLLAKDTTATRAAIAKSAASAILARGRPAYAQNGIGQPAQTIYAAWINEAVLSASGVVSFDLQMADHVMPTKGSLAVPGAISYA